jgi:D-sedoheptulose 7-phosphate isomerase
MDHFFSFFRNLAQTISEIDLEIINKMAERLYCLRKNNGRLFLLGVGGSAANCSHAVNDFRKLCAIEAYSPTDNVSELTARTNDEGWASTFSEWLLVSKINKNDALFIFSVGGGDEELDISPNLVRAIQLAKSRDVDILGVVGPNGGFTDQMGSVVLKAKITQQDLITPISESLQSIVWHALVSHPILQQKKAKWESCVLASSIQKGT